MKCPYCQKELGNKPQFSGIGLASSAFLNCDNGHGRVAFSGLTHNWSTKSASIANELSKRGVNIHRQGDVFSFDDNPILFAKTSKKKKKSGRKNKAKWWQFWK